MDKNRFPKIDDIDSRHCNSQNVKSKWPEFYEYLMNCGYPDNLKMSERLYWYFHNLNDYPKCPICGKPTSYINFKKGYHKYCCVSCSRKDAVAEERRKQTNISKYGCENPCQSKLVRDKIEKTMMKRYGVKRALQKEEFLKKSQDTCENHYGVRFPSQNKNIVKKQIQTMTKKYGGMGTASPITVEKIKQTNLEKYGCDWGWGSDKVRSKSIQTWREHYGVDNPFAAEEIKILLKEINLKKYGVDNVFAAKEIKEKIKQTNLKKYGVEYPVQSKEILDKIFITKKENGTSCSSQIEQDFKQWLIDNNIEFDHQHHDDNYPFDCDFYFPKTNSYLEIQGSWVHGPRPYNENNANDIDLLNKWKSKINENDKHSFYETAIYTWTERDVKKRQWAKDHNLNWSEVFTTDLNVLINECRLLNIF